MVGGLWKGTQCQYRRRSGLLAPHRHTEDVQTRGPREVFIWASRVAALLCALCGGWMWSSVEISRFWMNFTPDDSRCRWHFSESFKSSLGSACNTLCTMFRFVSTLKGRLCSVTSPHRPQQSGKRKRGFIELYRCQIGTNVRARSDRYLLPQMLSDEISEDIWSPVTWYRYRKVLSI